jgi:DNA invertase Pin-like site-specific DNA recombinase
MFGSVVFLDVLAIHEIVSEMKRAALYLRVSTDQQTTENQRLVLMEVAQRLNWEVVHVFEDQASGAKGRDQRPGFDSLMKAITRGEVEIAAAWSVDRLGRSLQGLVAFLSDIQGRCDLYLHQQAVDTSSPSGRMLFGLLSVFSEFERELVKSRVNAGLDRARAKGVRLGRPSIAPIDLDPVRKRLNQGQSIRVIARATGFSTATVQRVKRSMTTVEETVPATVAA